MKRFIIKLCTVCAIVAITIAATIAPSFAFSSTGEYFLEYFAGVDNETGIDGYDEGFWFDAEDSVSSAITVDREAFRGEPYVSYMRTMSTPSNLDNVPQVEDGHGPLWGYDEDEENRYIIFTPRSYFTSDTCIEEAYQITADVMLAPTVTEAGDTVDNVTGKFAGFRMYMSEGTAEECLNENSAGYTGTSGFTISFDIGDDTKDLLVVYIINSDGSVAEAKFDIAEGTFSKWFNFGLIDDYEGNISISIDDKVVAKVVLADEKGSLFTSAKILDAADTEKISTTKAEIYNMANMNFGTMNTGDICIDNWGVKAYEENEAAPSDPTEAPSDPTETPADETEAPADKTEAPADKTDAPANKTDAPANKTDAPANKTNAPAVDNTDEGGIPTGAIIAIVAAVVVVVAVVVVIILKKKKA